MEASKERRHVRTSLTKVLRGSVGLRTDARVINLSPVGAMIEHTNRLAPGGKYVFFMQLLGMDLRVGARIAWTQVAGLGPGAERTLRYRSGLHFLVLPEAAEVYLKYYLGSLMGRPSDRSARPAGPSLADARPSPAM